MSPLTESELSTKLYIAGIVLFLAFYAVMSAFLEHHKLPVHRGAVAVAIGVLVGLVIRLSSQQTYNQLTKLDQTVIFLVLLPAMLFAKGYTFKKGAFIKSFKFIALFGILGAFISYVVITSLVYAANQLNLMRDAKDITNFRTLSIWQVLLLSACMCSIDTVASEQAVDEHRFPKLNAIIVGQDTFKDCVTIVLFRSILRLEQMETPETFVFFWYTPLKIVLNFGIMIVGSSVFGAVMAGVTAFMFRKLRFLSNDRGITQTTVLFLLGFTVYVLSQCLTFSGIISILCYGVVLNRYNFFNLSPVGQITSKNTFLFVSNISEGLLFLIMGIMVWQVEWSQEQPTNPITHSYVFCLIVMLILVVGRFVNVYLLAFLTKLLRPSFSMKREELFVIFVSGLARGATPFALFTSVEFSEGSAYAKNEGLVLKTTIIIIVMFCTLVLNSLIPTIFRKPLKRLREQAKQYLIDRENESSQNRIKQLAKSRFKQFEVKYLKPILIYDFETRKLEIEETKRKLKEEHRKMALKQLQEEEEESIDLQSSVISS